MTLVGLALDLYVSLATGNDDADALRWPLIYGLLKQNVPMTPDDFADTMQQGRGLMLVLLCENSMNPTAPYPGPVGDLGIAKGPSISPWQILRTNAIACGYVDPSTTSDQYAQIDTLGDIYNWADHAANFWKTQVWNHTQDLRLALQTWNGGPNGPNNTNAQAYAQNGISGSSPAAPPGAPTDWGIA